MPLPDQAAKEIVTEIKTIVIDGVSYDRTPGSPFDSGSADSYYGSAWSPSKGIGSERVDRISQLTDTDIAEYTAGYTWNEEDYGVYKS